MNCANMMAVSLATGVQDMTMYVLIPTQVPYYYYKEKKEKGEGEADGEKGMRASCLLSHFLLSRGIVDFGV